MTNASTKHTLPELPRLSTTAVAGAGLGTVLCLAGGVDRPFVSDGFPLVTFGSSTNIDTAHVFTAAAAGLVVMPKWGGLAEKSSAAGAESGSLESMLDQIKRMFSRAEPTPELALKGVACHEPSSCLELLGELGLASSVVAARKTIRKYSPKSSVSARVSSEDGLRSLTLEAAVELDLDSCLALQKKLYRNAYPPWFAAVVVPV